MTSRAFASEGEERAQGLIFARQDASLWALDQLGSPQSRSRKIRVQYNCLLYRPIASGAIRAVRSRHERAIAAAVCEIDFARSNEPATGALDRSSPVSGTGVRFAGLRSRPRTAG